MFKEKKWSNRIQLILLVVIFCAPLTGAYYCFYFSDSKCLGETNVNGELYLPKPLDLENIKFLVTERDGASQEQAFNELESRWYLVVVANKECNELCERNLKKISYVESVLVRYAGRIVATLAYQELDSEKLSFLQKKYALTTIKASTNQDFIQWLKPFYEGRKKTEIDVDRIYVIDPVKKLMMSYPVDALPKDDIYEDMKRLLKISRVR